MRPEIISALPSSDAACAYWASGYNDALAVTIDGQGEGVTSQVYLVRSGKFELLKEVVMPHSLGILYAAVTKALGFEPAKHEGKITGLAAYAQPDAHLLSEIQKMAFYDEKGETICTCSWYKIYKPNGVTSTNRSDNAALIASAPAMYEMLYYIMKGEIRAYAHEKRIKELLSKARGE